jgi:hypothetical protein
MIDPDLSSERAPYSDKTATFRQQSSDRGSGHKSQSGFGDFDFGIAAVVQSV